MNDNEELNPYFNPIPFLESLKGKKISVKLKWGHEYKGILLNYDDYMNLQMQEVEEWLNDQLKGNVEEILLRCNNVLYIRELDEEEDNSQMKTEIEA